MQVASADAGILTSRTGTTGSDLSAHYAWAVRVTDQPSDRSSRSSHGWSAA